MAATMDSMSVAKTMHGTSLKLPFLTISRRTPDGARPVACPGHVNFALAFTALPDASAYLQSQHSPDLEIELVFRQSLAHYLEGLEDAGFLGAHFAASADSSREATFSIAELRAMIG